MVIPYQISNLNRLPSPPSTLLIRRNEIEIYRAIERHCGEPFEFFVWIVILVILAVGGSHSIIILVCIGIFIVATG